ncbi:MAG: tyrosine-type recombinase/integrase, partial [Oscillospiraceae bacterium]|nr:tyrosine-type recombinase/integrase [Oscillospiraceae bacterium]
IPIFGQHALRHTFATRCIESGIPPVVLKNWLGHTNIHVTLDTYTDVFNGMNNKAVHNLDMYLENL